MFFRIAGRRHCPSAVFILPAILIIWPALSAPGQDKTSPSDAIEGEAPFGAATPERDEETPPDEEAEEVDPRVILREERARRERIESLSRAQPRIEQEGAALAGPNVPPGLLAGTGVRFGNVVVSPRATVGAVFTDNADSDDDDRESDVILGANADLRADALLRRHALGVQATATTGASVNGSEDEFLDWEVGGDGRYDLTRRNSLNAAVTASLFREADSSAAAEADDDDATVNTVSGGLGYAFDGRLWDFSLNGLVDREAYAGDDTAERDNTTYTASTRLVHRLSNRLSIFVAPQYSLNEFDDIGNEGQDRDSSQVTGLVGVDTQLRPRLSLGASIGYSQTFFDDPDVEENGSVVGALDAAYIYDGRTNYRLSVNRQIDVTTVDDAVTETSTVVAAEVTKLLAPKHALTTQATYAYNEFDDGDRRDHDVTGAVGYFFQFTENFVFNLGYQYFTRFSDEDAEEFDENRAFIGVTVAY